MKYNFAAVLISLLLFTSCSEDTKPYELPANALSLLHGDSTKTWKIARRYNDEVRMNMGPCFMDYRQTFQNNNTVSDNNAINTDCGPSLKGEWELKKSSKGHPYIKISSKDIPKLLNTEKNYKNFKILKLNKDTLKLSFRHKQYGNKYRTITDVLVREDLDIGDRYFHH